jgi:5-deoxy-glucuronate isomerase
VSVEAGDEHWQSIGTRDRVFEDAAPYAVYLPPKLAAIVRAERDAEIGVASAPAKGEYPPRLIEPSHMKRSTRGKNAKTRYVCGIRPQTQRRSRCTWWKCARRADMRRAIRRKHDQDNVPVESRSKRRITID